MARPKKPRYETKFVKFADWLTLEQAAQTLGVTSTRVRQLVFDGRFKEVAAIGDRPLYLVPKAEVDKMAGDPDR